MPLSVLDWREVRRHYDDREDIHRQLLKLHARDRQKEFVDLALGISDKAGNYSASDHTLGPQIRRDNRDADQRVFELAGLLMHLPDGIGAPILIDQAGLKRLKIGVGSEMSCMVNPKVCWVANTRTIWTHLVFKHHGNIRKANEELALYRDENESSEMAYRRWTALHGAVVATLKIVAIDGAQKAEEQKIRPGGIPFLWADAICSSLYAHHHD
jgi:hypothetical protein